MYFPSPSWENWRSARVWMILPAVESVMCKELTDSVDMGAFQERHLSLLLKMNLDSLLRLPSDLEKVGLTVDWFLIYQPRQKAFGNNVERQLIIKKTSMKLSKQHWKILYFPAFFLLNCWNGIKYGILYTRSHQNIVTEFCVFHTSTFQPE